jgi:hypothetical protein
VERLAEAAGEARVTTGLSTGVMSAAADGSIAAGAAAPADRLPAPA